MMPNGAGDTSPSPLLGTGGTSFSVMISGSGASQGLRCGPKRESLAASAIASTSRARSVCMVPSSVASAARVWGSGRPRSLQPAALTVTVTRSRVTVPGRRPPMRADWTPTGPEAPDLTKHRPGTDLEIHAASGTSITSCDSLGSVTRSAIRRLVLARMSADTTPAGRWVARIRCTPRERPRWAMPTSPVTKSGSSATSEANSSMISTSRGSGPSPRSGRSRRVSL
jgi:hypothetical protein